MRFAMSSSRASAVATKTMLARVRARSTAKRLFPLRAPPTMKSDVTTCPDPPSKTGFGSAPGQVSWLSDRPTPRAFPTRCRSVALAGFGPDHSDGVAAASTAFPGPSWASRTRTTPGTLTKSPPDRNWAPRRTLSQALAAAGAAPRSVVQHVLEVPDAAGEVHEHLLRQLRDFPQELPEIDPIDHEHAQVGLGLHGGRAWLAIEQAHLAEKLTGPQPAPLVHRDRHQRGPVDDDEEFVAGLTLPGEDGPLRNLHDLRDVGDGAELAHAARLEDGDPLEILDLLLTGGPEHFEDLADQSHYALVSFVA